MAGKLLPLLLLFAAACSSRGAQADLQYIKEARSAAAEWALVNDQANRGRLTPAYVRSMHYWLRQDLSSAASALTEPDSRYALEIRALMAQPDDADPEELRAHADKLKDIENQLESA